MKTNDRSTWLDLTAARYLEAMERGDFAAMEAIWQLASQDAELETILHEVHAGLLEEQSHETLATTTAALTAAVEAHLPSAEIVRPSGEAVTVADVANELFRHTPDRLPADAHVLNEKLRTARELLPADLGLSKLVEWAEAKFGPAPADYWKVFRQAAVKLELRRSSEIEYHLAARPAPKREDKP